MPTLLITGANRGIGLEFTKQYLADGWRVHACCRQPDKAKELKALEGVEVHRLDVTEPLQCANLTRELREEPIDLLINNAGVYGPRSGLENQDFDAWRQVMEINLFGAMRVVERFLSQLEKAESPVIVNMSSRLGSIASNEGGGSYPYRTSKCALNMLTKNLAVDLADKGVTVVSVHPGWVQTEMGGKGASLSAEESVTGLRKVIAGLTPEQTGGFFGYDGSELPW